MAGSSSMSTTTSKNVRPSKRQIASTICRPPETVATPSIIIIFFVVYPEHHLSGRHVLLLNYKIGNRLRRLKRTIMVGFKPIVIFVRLKINFCTMDTNITYVIAFWRVIVNVPTHINHIIYGIIVLFYTYYVCITVGCIIRESTVFQKQVPLSR